MPSTVAHGLSLKDIEGKVVHHKNEKSWIDEPWNLELKDDSKHRAEHFSGSNNPRYIGWTKEQAIKIGRKLVSDTDIRKHRWQKVAKRGKVPSTRTIQLMFGSWMAFRAAVMEG